MNDAANGPCLRHGRLNCGPCFQDQDDECGCGQEDCTGERSHGETFCQHCDKPLIPCGRVGLCDECADLMCSEEA